MKQMITGAVIMAAGIILGSAMATNQMKASDK